MPDAIQSFVIYHRDFVTPPNGPGHTILAKGDFRAPPGVNYVSDATGDHVAYRSPEWSEITAMYWVWRNAQRPEYVSFPHYRRHFWFISDGRSGRFRAAPTTDTLTALVSEANYSAARAKLRFGDCIVADPFSFQISLELQYRSLFPPEFWDGFMQSMDCLGYDFIKRKNWFGHTTQLHYAHLFVMRWSDFDEYMEHLMLLLQRLDEVVRRHPTFVPRAQAHMVERFFNYYLFVKGLRYVSCPVAILDNEAF